MDIVAVYSFSYWQRNPKAGIVRYLKFNLKGLFTYDKGYPIIYFKHTYNCISIAFVESYSYSTFCSTATYEYINYIDTIVDSR